MALKKIRDIPNNSIIPFPTEIDTMIPNIANKQRRPRIPFAKIFAWLPKIAINITDRNVVRIEHPRVVLESINFLKFMQYIMSTN